MAAVELIAPLFFKSSSFAVVGASKDQTKFGTKILKWYQARDLAITPVHHKEAELEGLQTVKSIEELASPSTTSISIVTPAKVTLGILQKAKELNVPALWIQPGAEDKVVIDFIKENGMADKVIYGGACVLEDGDGYRTKPQ